MFLGEGPELIGSGLFNLRKKVMKVIFDVSLTENGHTMQFSTEEKPLYGSGNVDVVKYKKMLLLVKNTVDSVLTAMP